MDRREIVSQFNQLGITHCDNVGKRQKGYDEQNESTENLKPQSLDASQQTDKNTGSMNKTTGSHISGSIDDTCISVDSFYLKAKVYWSKIDATVNGMLGGLERLDFADVRGSRQYLNSVFQMKPAPRRHYALDCGAGIGRVTKRVLIPEFERVDAVEQNRKFTNEMRKFVGDTNSLGEIYNQGLQDFTPQKGKYDVIWTQWVLGHLTDEDLVAFFKRCIEGLTRNGVIIIKENVTSTSQSVEMDTNDSSVTRPIMYLKSLLCRSGLRILRSSLQNNFPSGLLPVYMITARPAIMANNSATSTASSSNKSTKSEKPSVTNSSR